MTKICPNLLIIGAQKSGTTSLYHYLKIHPHVFMSNPLKEPGYYWRFDKVKDYFARKGITIESRHDLLANHMLKNYKGEPVFGEASTYYTIGNYRTNYKINNPNVPTVIYFNILLSWK